MEPAVSSKTRTVIKILRIIVVLVVAAAAALVLVKTRPHPARQEAESKAPLVDVLQARSVSPNMVIHAYGTINSGQNLDLVAQVGGSITEMSPAFEEGAYFSKGAFLMRIDPRDYELNLERLRAEVGRLDAEIAKLTQERKNFEATLEIARKDVKLAQAEYERNVLLFKKTVVAQNQLDQAEQKVLVSKTRVQEIENSIALIKPRADLFRATRATAQAQAEQAQLDLERTEITAPFDCRVAVKNVEKYQYVAKGARLGRIYDVGLMEVVVRIPMKETKWLGFDMINKPPGEDDPKIRARISLDSPDRDAEWPGFVSRVKGEVEERTRTLPLVVEIEDGRDQVLTPAMPGMFVDVALIGKKVDNVFLLPRGALHDANKVYIVNDGEVKIKQVIVVRYVDNEVYVTGGLSDGDRVILQFPGAVSEGLHVRVKDQPTSPGETK